MDRETQRFRLLGGRPPSLEELIKDCRSLEEEVRQSKREIQELKDEIKALRNK
jgi:peptidoglycan hydrolase CwlO-like protein